MEVYIYSVKTKIQAGNIWVKDIITTQKGPSQKKSAKDLKNLSILPGNSAEGLWSRRECYWGYVSIYENTPKKAASSP